ncbi:hypothetical protein GGS21DRAFT_487603 [Xylaria nigripes]|nr:hypothetical protein GGS21DRAFT_487603 [Xylaria nigripes]
MLDQVQYMHVGSQLQFCPLSIWLPVSRVSDGREDDAHDLYRIGKENPVEYNLHVLVMVHVPSFAAEAALKGGVHGVMSGIDTLKVESAEKIEHSQDEGNGNEPARKCRRGATCMFRSGMCLLSGISELAGGLTSENHSVALFAPEVRQMKTTVYWTQDLEIFTEGRRHELDGVDINARISGGLKEEMPDAPVEESFLAQVYCTLFGS